MLEHLFIGSSPTDESCAQVGQDNYMEESRIECRRFIDLIRKKFGDEPEKTRLAIKSSPHDFGTYLEVVVYFNPEDEESRQYAYAVEDNTPATWWDESVIDWKTEVRFDGTKDSSLDSPC